MFNKKLQNKDVQRLFELTEACFDNLEEASAVIALVEELFSGDKKFDIAIKMATVKIKKAVEIVLEIQNNL